MENPTYLRSLKPKLIENIKVLNKNITNNKIFSNISNNNHFKPDIVKVKKSFWIEGYGCSANYADLEMITGQLKHEGYEMADSPNQASINLIITCSVKDATEHKMVHRIKKLSNTNKPLIIGGCLPAADRKLIEKVNPQASLMNPNSIHKTIDIVKSTIEGQRVIQLEKNNIEKVNLPRFRINPIISIVEIASGCLSNCSFCQTKLAKGELKSYRPGEILKHINTDISDGVKEIWLTSTDNGCYGLDIGTNLVELIRKCDKIDTQFKLRIGMMNPMYLEKIAKDLIEIYKKSDKIYKFIHIPVQSGSEKVLKDMKRGHTAKTFRKIVKKIREDIPDITIATDIITGYPSETESDFEDTINLINETEPDIVNSSKYSSRPGTSSFKLNKIDTQIVLERSQKIHKIIKTISHKRNSKWIHWEGDILLNEIEGSSIKGRNNFYKTIILEKNFNTIERENPNNDNNKSNVTINPFINMTKIKLKSKDENNNLYKNNNINNEIYKLLGQSIRVKVTNFTNHILFAKQIN